MIVLDEGQRHEVESGRLMALIRWLMEHRERVEEQQKVEITFHCSGERASAIIKDRLDVDPALFQ